jgi:diguanylate cyclase (GGDEF)-like protein
VENKGTSQISQSEFIDLSLWHEFQEGLSDLLDTSLTLYDGNGSVLAPPSGVKEPYKATNGREKGEERYGDLYLKAISKATEKGQICIFKCNADQYIFAVPVSLKKGLTFVIIGGGPCLSRDEVGEFTDGVSESIFNVPNKVKAIAVPYLKCLFSCARGEEGVSYGSDITNRLRAFHALQEVWGSIAPVLDRQELYEAILSKSTELVGAEQGSLMVLDDDVLSVRASRGIDRTVVENLKVRLGESIAGHIAKNGVPLVVSDIEKAIPSRKNRPRYKTKSFVSIPLKMESRVIGVINISDKITGEVFTKEDLNILLSFANYASIALEREAYYSMSEELKTISMTDPLTGLFNRRYFLQRLFEEVERVKRHKECFTVFMIDIDDFKAFNDKYGHMAGDEILKYTAGAIKEGVRAIDVVARFGGEEFSVILPSTSKEESLVIAERIRKSVERMRLPEEKFSIKEGLTISLGVAEFAHDAWNIEELLHNADKAMYLAKSMGKNRVVGYER